MPLYEYRCRACAGHFERILPMAAGPEQACACGGTADKLVTNVAFLGRRAAPGPDALGVPLRRRLPSSLQGVGGTRAGVAAAQRAEEKLSSFEARNPEFVDRKLPVVSHEGGRIVHATEKPVKPERVERRAAG